MKKIINQAPIVRYRASVSEIFFPDFWNGTFSAESHCYVRPHELFRPHELLLLCQTPRTLVFPLVQINQYACQTPTPDPVAEYTAERTSKCVDVCVHNTILLGFYLVVLKKFSQISQHHSVADD